MSSEEELSPPATSAENREIAPYEKHRPLVRDTDKKLSRTYGFGGGAVLAAGGLVFVIAWVAGIGPHLATFVVAVTVVLMGLFVLRGFVNRQRDALRRSVESYCELNDIDIDKLRKFAEHERIYPYFEALFQTREPQ